MNADLILGMIAGPKTAHPHLSHNADTRFNYTPPPTPPHAQSSHRSTTSPT